MKSYTTTLLILCCFYLNAQIPSDYYENADGLTGLPLKTALKKIITQGHIDRSYSDLYTAYRTTHTDTSFENDGTVLDFYSEVPSGIDPYNYTHFNRQCGNQTEENDCYNREHLVPQSVFNRETPMRTDVHHVIPSDGHVNNRRSNFAFGKVANATYTSQNGSKAGSSATSGYFGTVFEPIDEFKGDIARAVLYFVTRYEDNMDTYNWFMFDGSENKALNTWAINLLLDWHNNIDPVDDIERARNNAAYNYQGNANPFIDHPEYANMIWNTTPDNEAPSSISNLNISNTTSNSISLSWDAATDNIGISDYEIRIDGLFNKIVPTTNATLYNLNPDQQYNISVISIDTSGNKSIAIATNASTTKKESNINCNDSSFENFENIPNANSSYTNREWVGNSGGLWKATEARTDLTNIDESSAITIDTERGTPIVRGKIVSPTISGGIKSLTLSVMRVFSGSNEALDIKINNTVVGTIPYNNTTVITRTIDNINIEGDFVIELSDDDANNRIVIDNISWVCYEENLSKVNFQKKGSTTFYPNPSNNGIFKTKNLLNIKASIYDINGILLFNTKIDNTLNLESLSNGVYFLKINNSNTLLKLVKG